MEDSFRVRVDKVFGSLSSSSSTEAPISSSLSSLWSLTDDEVEKKEWNRHHGSPQNEPGPEPDFFSTLQNLSGKNMDFQEELEDLDDFDQDEDEEPRSTAPLSRSIKPEDYNDEEWEIKSSIGLDCTLDYEEEKDHYDKVAVGEENEADRLYMNVVEDYGVDIDSSVLPNTLEDFTRDPRANHLAAKIRLKEDSEAAQNIDSLQVLEIGALPAASADKELDMTEKPKPILKRKDNNLDSKSQKRVRFDPTFIDTCNRQTEGSKDTTMETCISEAAKALDEGHLSGVPDYVRNPSKYTHYAFDTATNMDEESNKLAYMDFLEMVKGSQQGDAPIDLPKTITFIPKKRVSDALMLENGARVGKNQELVHHQGMRIGFAAGDPDTSEVCAMEEDETKKSADSRINTQKVSRQYRTRDKVDSDDA